MRPVWREPLVHFLILGAALFGVGAILGGGSSGREKLIVVTTQDIEWLETAWERQWRRPPTDEELDALIDHHVREEVLYREARAMGLDENDTVIRRRLVQKLEFVTEDLVDEEQPAEEELRRDFDAHPDRYRIPELRTFTHVYFSVDRRGDSTREDARLLLAELEAMAEPPRRAPERGDRFMMQYDYPRRSRAEVTQHMGREFADALFELEPGSWRGPLRSGYGIHLVRVSEVVAARLPDYSAVREEVREDLMRERRERANESFYERLRSNYRVRVEKPSESP